MAWEEKTFKEIVEDTWQTQDHPKSSLEHVVLRWAKSIVKLKFFYDSTKLEPFNSLQHNSHLTTLRKKPFENIVGKGEMLLTSIFSISHNVFSTLPEANFSCSVTLNMSSANALNLDQSKNLSFGKEINT